MIEAWLSESEMTASSSPNSTSNSPPLASKQDGIEDGVLGAEEGGDFFLELFVQGLGAADEAHGGHAEAPAVERGPGGGDHLGMVGEAEVVVGAHVDHRAPVLEADGGVLRGIDEALAFVEAGGFDFRERGLK